MGRRSCPADIFALVPGAAGLRAALDAASNVASEAGSGVEPRLARASRALRLWFANASPSLFIAALALCLTAATLVSSSTAQAAGESATKKDDQHDKMLVEAIELRYDADKDIVSAEGDARVYYKGRVLEADKVIYDRKSGRVYAEGHAKMTEPDGMVERAERFDLTDDFRDGFIESVQADTTQKTQLSAPHAERIEGDTTVYTKGTYTACGACTACDDNPDKPPLWRVRAKRIVHKNDEKMIYYQDASLEFLGVPIAYVPFFSAPDPTVTRKSGLLMPQIVPAKTYLGYGVGVPIFWALAPNYDLTFTPTFWTTQGFLAEGEWRHRLENGEYYIRATGIDQLNRAVFPVAPYGAGDERFRGSFESKGKLFIADDWKFGWEFTLLSDKFFLNDYHIPSQTVSSNYFSETTSTVYLTGQADRGYFDLRGYAFEGLSTHDFQPQQPIAHPVLDYNKTFDIDPAKSFGVGGQVEFDFNLTSLSASSASYQSVGTQVLDNAYGLYNICNYYTPGRIAGSCLLRGIGGDYTRVTADLSWQRKFIDPIGEVWTPFAFAHVNGEWLDLNTSNIYSFANNGGVSTFSNASQLNFLGNKDDALYGAFVPGAGFEYRYPFLARTGFGSMVFEPIGQIIGRPGQTIGSYSLVNLDAQSLVFDDTNLFEWSKYSGYDRFETGLRANYGAQFSLNFNGGGHINMTAGQSYQLAGPNSYATPDAANVGLSSGLDTRRSDYVTAFSFAPNSALSFTAKSRFDVDTFEARRIDLVATFDLGAWKGDIQYANYQAQPVIGYYVRREGLSLSSRYSINENYFAQGNVTFDMSRQFYPASLIGTPNPGPFAIAAFGVGGGYQDCCTTFSVNYTSVYQDNGNGGLTRNQTVLVQLQLRTLGDFKFSQVFNSTAALDGVKY